MSVVVYGRGYVAGRTTVRVGGTLVATEVRSQTQVRFTAPAHANGYVVIEIVTPAEKAYAELLYVPPPLDEIGIGHITTVAGIGKYLAEGRQARSAPVEPMDVAIAPDGALYLAEPQLGVVRRVRADGVIERVAGIGADYAGQDIGEGGPARDATLVFPVSIAFGPDGALYVADTFNHRIRRVGSDGLIHTVAGSGPNGSCCLGEFGGDGGPAIAAKLNQPNQVRFDGAGNMYILDALNARIRKVATNGIITTVAGSGVRGFSGDGGPATSARFDTGPNGDTGALRVTSDGTIYLLDVNNRRLRRVDAVTGVITTIAGGGTAIEEGALATEAQLPARGFDVAADGSIYVSEFTRIRRIGTDGRMQTVFGTSVSRFSEDGVTASNGTLASLDRMVLRNNGQIVFIEFGSLRVREINATGRLVTLAGIGPAILGENGPAIATQISSGSQLALSAANELVFGGASRVRSLARDGTVRTIVGGGTPPAGPPPSPRPALGIPVDSNGLVFHPSGALFMTAYRDIGRLDPDGTYTTLCCRDYGFAGDGGLITHALIDNTAHMAIDSHGNLFFADTANHRIRRIDAQTSVITTVAGTAPPHPPNVLVQNPSSGDGGPATAAQLNAPNFIAIDGNDRLYIADTPGIRTIDANGTIRTTLPGCSGPMTRDTNGDILVYCNSMVMRIARSGAVSNVVTFGGPGVDDGGPAASAQLGFINGIAVDRDGNLFLFDNENRRIRAVRGAGVRP